MKVIIQLEKEKDIFQRLKEHCKYNFSKFCQFTISLYNEIIHIKDKL